MLPVQPKPLAEQRDLFPAALERVYDVERMAEWVGNGNRPGEKPEHVFDFEDGLRLIVSRELFPEGRMIHLSASVNPGPLFRRLTSLSPAHAMCEFRACAESRFRDISGMAVPRKTFLGWTEGKGVPHWCIPEPKGN